ncbi:hypothetical protein J4438_03360 [Candidatus Woesearchaeota archaeon]|nr:hypothetical protein [Candidatus Woesearchaeota archaeon]
MKFISKKEILIDKELSELDLFTLDFIKILKKYTNYVIVSGYVSILLGRSRVSEDVDIIIPKLDFKKFELLADDLKKNNFYCLNNEKNRDIYDYLVKNTAVRFAKKNTVIPNIEIKFEKNKFDKISLNNTIKVKIENYEIVISQLELQIAFKEKVLKSQKDMEDARHIRNVANEHLNFELIDSYKVMLNEFY